ncbi:hypothetical protein AB5J62_14095 [Amycolatopsis sp. cg5]|uniref:hypothetical protein n=1 Tax=Amycolatopsis sp. cg5 TaxID=3238802 RepID=UPI0035251946
MAFNATWKPGADSAADMHLIGQHLVALVIYLDPDSLAFTPPNDAQEWPEFARLMRQIRDGADKVADFVDRNQAAALSEQREEGHADELPGVTT